MNLLKNCYHNATVLGRNRFVQTGFRFYPEAGFGLVVQIKWTVWPTDANRLTVATGNIW